MLQFLESFDSNGIGNSERISIEQYNRELEESERQIEKGNFITQEELEKELEKW